MGRQPAMHNRVALPALPTTTPAQARALCALYCEGRPTVEGACGLGQPLTRNLACNILGCLTLLLLRARPLLLWAESKAQSPAAQHPPLGGACEASTRHWQAHAKQALAIGRRMQSKHLPLGNRHSGSPCVPRGPQATTTGQRAPCQAEPKALHLVMEQRMHKVATQHCSPARAYKHFAPPCGRTCDGAPLPGGCALLDAPLLCKQAPLRRLDLQGTRRRTHVACVLAASGPGVRGSQRSPVVCCSSDPAHAC